MVKRSKEGGSSMSNENGGKETESIEVRMTEHFTWLSIKHGERDDDECW